MPLRLLSARSAQWLVQAFARWIATYAIVQGFLIIMGGPERWLSSRALAAALAVPGAPSSWGVVLLAAGILALWGTFRDGRLASVGFWGIAFWSACFAIGLTFNVVTTYTAPTTGPIVYGKDVIPAVLLALVYRRVAK